MKIVVLYSGGLDSRIMYQMAKVKNPGAEVKALYWDYGHQAARSEIAHLPDFVEVRKVDWYNLPNQKLYAKDGDPSGPIYIPGRNLVFSVLSACEELADEVHLGALAEEDNPKGTDKNSKFTKMSSELLSYVLSPFIGNVKVRIPLAEAGLNKLQAVKWGLENGLTPEDYKNTMSCYHESDEGIKPCGNCKQCLRRFAIFGEMGFDELDNMLQHPLKAEHSRKWLIDLVQELEENGWNPPLSEDLHFPYISKYLHENKEFQDDVELMDALSKIDRYLEEK